MKKIWLVIASVFLCTFWYFSSASALTYPIKNIPIIQNADYLKYRNDKIYRQTYSMLWSSTYYDGWDMGLGWHQWVDIVGKIWDPVYAMTSGEVIFAGEKWKRWKTLTIKHVINNKLVYSSYSHLSEILVESGQKVWEGIQVAKLGDTWNSTGPHLHFQVEINDNNNHPFFYENCIWEISEIVNEARCQKQMYDNTVDPILFIEKKWNLYIAKDKLSNKDNNDINQIIYSGFAGWIVDKNSIIKVALLKKTNTDQMIILSGAIKITYNKDIVKVLPDSFQLIPNRNIMIIHQKPGITMIDIKYWNKLIKRIPVIVADELFLQKIKLALTKNPNLIKDFVK